VGPQTTDVYAQSRRKIRSVVCKLRVRCRWRRIHQHLGIDDTYGTRDGTNNSTGGSQDGDQAEQSGYGSENTRCKPKRRMLRQGGGFDAVEVQGDGLDR